MQVLRFFFCLGKSILVFRQLGFECGGVYYTGSHWGSVSSVFAMDDVVCSGSEDYLQDCTYSLSDNCGSYDGAGVLCYTSCSATTTTTTIHDKNVE